MSLPFLSSVPFYSLLSFSSSSLSHSSLPCPTNTAMRSGEWCKLPSGSGQAQLLNSIWCILYAETAFFLTGILSVGAELFNPSVCMWCALKLRPYGAIQICSCPLVSTMAQYMQSTCLHNVVFLALRLNQRCETGLIKLLKFVTVRHQCSKNMVLPHVFPMGAIASCGRGNRTLWTRDRSSLRHFDTVQVGPKCPDILAPFRT